MGVAIGIVFIIMFIVSFYCLFVAGPRRNAYRSSFVNDGVPRASMPPCTPSRHGITTSADTCYWSPVEAEVESAANNDRFRAPIRGNGREWDGYNVTHEFEQLTDVKEKGERGG